MTLPSYESGLRPLLERLEAAQAVVDAGFARKEDRALIRSLEEGSYGARELDLLFEQVEKPLLAAVTVLAAGYRRDRPYLPSDLFGDDPFSRTVALLAGREHRSLDSIGLPVIDLLDDHFDDAALGRKGAAQVGLVRRLVKTQGYEGLQVMMGRILEDPGSMQVPQTKTAEECARLLGLVAPIERNHILPMLYFLSPTGQLVHSSFNGNTQCAAEYYMGVDK